VSVPRRARPDGTLDTGTIFVPDDAHSPVQTEQAVNPERCVHVHGPGGADPRASGRSAEFADGGMWVTVRACKGCGAWYPAPIEEFLTLCPRCTYSSLGAPSETVAAAMGELRWRLNEYQRVRERDLKAERAALLKLSQAAWVSAPILLAGLELLYGDQQVQQVHELTGGSGG
jgi:hypothetical protein